MTNEEIIHTFESVEEPSLELMQDAYVARDLIFCGADTSSENHKINFQQTMDKFKFYFYSDNDKETLSRLQDCAANGDLVNFYGCLNEEQLVVLGW